MHAACVAGVVFSCLSFILEAQQQLRLGSMAVANAGLHGSMAAADAWQHGSMAAADAGLHGSTAAADAERHGSRTKRHSSHIPQWARPYPRQRVAPSWLSYPRKWVQLPNPFRPFSYLHQQAAPILALDAWKATLVPSLHEQKQESGNLCAPAPLFPSLHEQKQEDKSSVHACIYGTYMSTGTAAKLCMPASM
eukprot:1158013-Pelagomonas_calceolata.AAC.10